jgi:hypothetical protein
MIQDNTPSFSDQELRPGLSPMNQRMYLLSAAHFLADLPPIRSFSSLVLQAASHVRTTDTKESHTKLSYSHPKPAEQKKPDAASAHPKEKR